jgi:hypothetical protein
MRRLIATLVAAVALAGFAVAATGASASASTRFVTVLKCRLTGGLVVANLLSPTNLSCRGGLYDGFWVLR